MTTRLDELQADLADLRARSLATSPALRKCEPLPPSTSKLRAKNSYALAVVRSGGASAVANEEDCHESTIRYRIELPTRNVHLEHCIDLPPSGLAHVIAELQTVLEEKLARLRRVG